MKKILIVLMGSLGDVSRGFVLLPALKKAYAGVHITWLVEPKCAGIVKLHPLIDEVVIFERARGVRAVFKLKQQLRSEKLPRGTFDLVLDLQRHFKSGFFAWMAAGKRSIGFHPRNAKEFNWIFHKEYIEEVSENVSKVRHYQKFLKCLSIEESDLIRFGLEDLELALPKEVRAESRCIGVVLGSSWSSKDLPPQGYVAILKALLARYQELQLLLLGDASHVDLCKKLLAACKSERVIGLAGKTSLRELLSVLRICTVVVGPDSGPGHLAATVGTPYVGIFGPTPPERVAPFGSELLAVKSTIGCAPCWRRTCPGLDKLCMRLASIPTVLERIESVIEENV